MYLLSTSITNRILLVFTHVDTGDSYPDDLIVYGLSKVVLISAMSEIEAGNATVANWSLSGKIPTIGFYRALYLYLKQHFEATKTSVGKLYCATDVNMKEREVDLTTFIDLSKELFHLTAIQKN